VSALRWKSASIIRMASRAQGRWSLMRESLRISVAILGCFPHHTQIQ